MKQKFAILLFLFVTNFLKGESYNNLELLMQQGQMAFEANEYFNSPEYLDSLPPPSTLSFEANIANDPNAYATAQEAQNSIDLSQISTSGSTSTITVTGSDPEEQTNITTEEIEEIVGGDGIHGGESEIMQQIQDSGTSTLYGLENNELGNDTYIDSATSSARDNDNDVPTLIMIWRRQAEIFQKEKDQRGQLTNVVRDLQAEVQASRGIYFDENGSSTERNATLSDIVQAIRKSSVDDNETEDLNTSETSETQSELDTAINNIKDAFSELEGETFSPEPLGSDFGKFTWNFGTDANSETKTSVDLLNLDDTFDSGMFNLPTIEESATWVKRIIAFVVFSIYFLATYNMGVEMFKLLTYSTESNPVSNYSVLGNSAGTVVIKTAKIALVASMVIFISSALIATVNDCNFSFDGMDFSYGNVASGVIQGIGGNDVNEGFRASVYYLALFVPLDSISLMVAQFLVQKISIFAGLMIFNRALRLAS